MNKTRLLAAAVLFSVILSWFFSKAYYQNADLGRFNETIAMLQSTVVTLSERNDKLENENFLRTESEEPLFKIEQGQLTDEEHNFLEKVNKADFDIEFPDSVTRKYVYENGVYRLFNTKLNYELGDSFLYFDAYPYYNINLRTTDHMLVLEYNISAGTALTSFGAIMYNTINKEIINNNYSFGTSAGTSEVFVDGVEYYTNHREFE